MSTASGPRVVQDPDHQALTSIPRTMVDVAIAREVQEVQAAMTIAKRFPRDEKEAYDRVIKACQRRTLAEDSLYAYPRGDTTVTGPSIRLAECLAQCWGNIDFGIIEIEQRETESVVMAFAWDLQSNSRQRKVFTVAHKRYTRKGTYSLEDPRDIYEMVANQGARRLRSCILGVIPGDFVDSAIQECEKTLASGSSDPLSDRVRRMVVAFAEHGVSEAMIEHRLGHKIAVTIEAELIGLRKIYQAIKDHMADRSQFFELQPASSPPTGNVDLRDPAKKDAADSKTLFAPAAAQDRSNF